MRLLASLRQIDSLTPIEKADRIETAWFGGWSVVVQKGLHKQGDTVVYIEVDSCLPVDNPLFASLAERGTREIEGVKYHRLKTIKLKKQISQGFVLPVRETDIDPSDEAMHGIDLAEHFGIIKWDPEVHQPNARLAGNALRGFPTHIIPKTDQERIQNMPWIIGSDESFEASIKLDGSSMTVYHCTTDTHVYGVCSRNNQLKIDDPINAENAFVKTAETLDLQRILAELGRNIALQGELIGMGIQGNKEGLSNYEYHIYDVWDIDQQRYLLPVERRKLVSDLGLKHVPVLDENVVLSSKFKDVRDVLKYAEGPSLVNKCREGVVFKSNSYSERNKVTSFKAISNQFLLDNGDD